MAFSGNQITRLGLAAIPRALTGSFAGKSAGGDTPRAGLAFVLQASHFYLPEPGFVLTEPEFGLLEG